MRIITILFVSLGIISITHCGRADDTVQNIDQITKIYIDSLGQDMLNKTLSNSYQSINWNDVNGLTDVAPISFQLLEDSDKKMHFLYVSGAKRILKDPNENVQIYQSEIALNMTKTIDGKTISVNDTLVLNYENTPELFQLKTAFYNNQLVFTKVQGQSNIIKIVK